MARVTLSFAETEVMIFSLRPKTHAHTHTHTHTHTFNGPFSGTTRVGQ